MSESKPRVPRPLADEIFDAVRRAYTGDKPWNQPAGLAPIAPEVIATDPPHFRRISAISDSVCEVLDRWGIEEIGGER